MDSLETIKDEFARLSSELNSLKRKIEQQEARILVPISIFSYDTSPLESLVKYLKENRNLKYSEIASLINRDQRTIWITYQGAKKKKTTFKQQKKDQLIPAKEFANRKFSTLEIVVHILHARGLKTSEIVALLNKNRSTIATAARRYKRKNAL